MSYTALSVLATAVHLAAGPEIAHVVVFGMDTAAPSLAGSIPTWRVRLTFSPRPPSPALLPLDYLLTLLRRKHARTQTGALWGYIFTANFLEVGLGPKGDNSTSPMGELLVTIIVPLCLFTTLEMQW